MKEIVIAIIASGLFTKILDVILDYFKNKKSPLKEAIKLCLLKDLTDYGTELINAGTMSNQQYKAFCEGYDAYKALNGDGYADKLKREVDHLPLATMQAD